MEGWECGKGERESEGDGGRNNSGSERREGSGGWEEKEDRLDDLYLTLSTIFKSYHNTVWL